MTYQEMVSTRAQRAAAWAARKAESCAGCGVMFSQYGMIKDDAYVEDGRAYCSADCCATCKVAEAELAEYDALSD